MKKNAKKLRRQYVKKRERARLKRMQEEIMTQISEIIFPDLPPEMISQMNNTDNEFVRNGIEGKWIDGSEMTPEKERYLEEIANELYVKHTTPEQQEQLKKRFRDMNEITNTLYPGKKKSIHLDF